MGVFERLLGLGSLECFEALLVHQHVVFPNSSGGHKVDFLEVIVLIQCDAFPSSWINSNVSLKWTQRKS
jgi:hypothetical protein